MAAACDRTQRRPQAAGVLERISHRELAVARAPEDEARAAHALEVDAKVASYQRLRGADGVCVALRAREERLRHLGRKRGRIGGAPTAEDERPQQRRTR